MFSKFFTCNATERHDFLIHGRDVAQTGAERDFRLATFPSARVREAPNKKIIIIITMTWTGQACPFCDIKYANKKGLQNHLLSYTGKWRIPADGIHDVLKIQNLRILKDHSVADNTIFYRCPSCAMGISDLRKFEEHVFYRQHYGDDYNKDTDEKLLQGQPSFDPELHKIHVWRPKGPFKFLRLTLGK
jgi:uncharacterized C2H2 Zn-finger protein